MVHFGEQYLGFMPPPGQPYNVHGIVDGGAGGSVWVFIRGKGFGIFSFMFGLSFVLQMQRAERRRPGTDFRPRFGGGVRPLRDGRWHGLAYSGDILTVYAALGIPLILFYRVRDRWLLVLAVLLLVGVPRVARRVVQGSSTPAERQSLQSRMNADAEEHWHAVAEGECPRSSASTRPRGSGPSGSSSTGSWGGATRRSGSSCSASGPGGAGSSRMSRRTGGSSSGSGGGRGRLPCSSLCRGRSLRGGPGRGRRTVAAEPAGAMPDFSSWPVVEGMGFFDA